MKATYSLAMARRVRGASLLIAMFFMIIMAMLGIAIANTSLLEEKMAGGTRNRNLALQSAEAALREAETQLADTTFRATTFALFDVNNLNTSAYWENCFTATASVPTACAGAQKRTLTTALPSGAGAIAVQPEYVIERQPITLPDIENFRVTARGVGGTTDTSVILQSEFSVDPSP